MADKGIHSGHRSRLKERFLKDGLDNFEKHNMLELLLFFAIPQKDTNEIAHRLLNKFGSLKRVFGAPVDELCSVDGVSRHTATLIKLIPAIWGRTASEIDRNKTYDSLSKLGRLLVQHYAGVMVETVCVVLLDSSWKIIDVVNVCDGSVNQVYADFRKIVECVIRTNASKVLLAHNHPNGFAIPSSEDISSTLEIYHACNTLSIDFIEHLVVAGDKFEPILCKSKNVFWQKSNKENFYR